MKSKRSKSRFLKRAEYLVFRAAIAPIQRLSSSSAKRWSQRLGRLSYRLFRKRTGLALQNLGAVFPEKAPTERQRIAHASWNHFSGITIDFVRNLRKSPEYVASLVDVVGMNHFESARDLGKGVVLISAHFGSWEIGASRLVTLGEQVMFVARPLDNELLERDLYRSRTRTGVGMADRRRAARKLFETIEAGGVVVMLADQAVQKREGVLIPFLGRPAWTTTSPAKLSLKYGAPIVGVFCIPEGERVRAEFAPPIIPANLPESERTIEGITRRMNDLISGQIIQHPEIWLWMHDRWKGTEDSSKF